MCPDAVEVRPPELSRSKRIAFTVVAGLAPFLLLALAELALRGGGYGKSRALFIPAPFDSTHYLVPNPKFAARYFPGDPSPPTPPTDGFLRDKPAKTLRLFVLGESTTAGFPFPANGTFSRLLADRLRASLADSVEVVNVGIPATNTFALFDELPDILTQQPDAVLIYAGHNEYYGAMGSASTIRLAGNAGLVRLVLRLERLRTVQLLQRGVARVRNAFSRRDQATLSPSRMEELAGRDTLRLHGAGYSRGVTQFASNLDVILGILQRAHVRAYVGTLTSDLRDQHPFASDTGGPATNAGAEFAAAQASLAAHDTKAESLFVRARDLDLIRFRAPGEFNAVIRRVSAARGAVVVNVDSAFHRAAPDGIPGHDLFFEHVHPLPRGTALIADAFFDALAADGFDGHAVASRNATPTDTAAMQLTGLDRRVASLITEALTQRWPFVARDSGTRFLETYRPATTTDSLALAVVTGRMTWVEAKLGAAQRFESARAFPEAVAEYRGLMRDQPWNESPFRFAGRAVLAAGKPAEARPLLERAYEMGPTAYTCYALATLVRADSGGLPRAAALLRQSLQLGGFNPAVLYQLSLVLGQQGDFQGARASAVQLYRAAPSYPGLRDWMKLLGM